MFLSLFILLENNKLCNLNQLISTFFTGNKIKEFKNFFDKQGIEVKSLLDFSDIDIEETGKTFIENALIKARTIAKLTGENVIADDSGLEVFSLNNEPGIYSARYAGIPKDDNKNIDKLLKELDQEKNRGARFVCALALVLATGQEITTTGYLNGEILNKRVGNSGFGYDPVFYIPSLNKTMAEITTDEKNEVSHRANAFKKLSKKME